MSVKGPRRGPTRRPAATGDQASPERVAAQRVLQRVDEGAYADRAFASVARQLHLDTRQRGAAQRLSYGAVQRQRTCDWVIDTHVDRPDRMEAPVRGVLRLGVYELLFSDRVPVAASVDQAVRLARAIPGPPPRRSARGGLVNAVMRRVGEAREGIQARLVDDSLPLGVRYSFPDWMVDALRRDLGEEDAAGLMDAANHAAESSLRWNPLRGPRVTLVNQLGVPWHADPHLPEAIVIEAPLGFEETAAWQRGLGMPQSRASMLPARVLDPQAGERVIDMCAAPGAKSTHLAALCRNAADITCIELHESRAEALRETGRRMGARFDVRVGDARTLPIEGGADAVLVDAPCTGLGVLSARPDARWRRRPEALPALQQLQRELLNRALELTRPGGRVVYSTCTVLAAENEDVVRASGGEVVDITSAFPHLAHPRMPGALLSLPHRHGSDGFFVACVRRPSG